MDVGEEIYQRARAKIDQEWIDHGWTPEDAAREEEAMRLFEAQLASGRSPEDILGEWGEFSGDLPSADFRLERTGCAETPVTPRTR